MFFILTFSYAVIVIVPLLLCLLVPGTLSECALCLTYMSAFRSPKKKVKSDKKEVEEVEHVWKSHTALSQRLAELTSEHFEGLFFDIPGTSAEGNRQYQAQVWLHHVENLLVESADNWLSVISLRNELPNIEKQIASKITALQRDLLKAQKTLQKTKHQGNERQQKAIQESPEEREHIENLFKSWCRRVKALKTLHVY